MSTAELQAHIKALEEKLAASEAKRAASESKLTDVTSKMPSNDHKVITYAPNDLEELCAAGNKAAVEQVIEQIRKSDDRHTSWQTMYRLGLTGACCGNAKAIAARLVSEGTATAENAPIAAVALQKSLAELMIDLMLHPPHGHRPDRFDLNDAFRGACLARNVDNAAMVEFLLLKEEEHKVKPEKSVRRVLNVYMLYAAGAGNLDVVRCLTLKGADKKEDINEALRYACNNGHLPIAKYLVSMGANNWDASLKGAYNCKPADYVNVLGYLLKQGATNAGSVFTLPQDAQLIVELLTKSRVPSLVFAKVTGFEQVLMSGAISVLDAIDSVSVKPLSSSAAGKPPSSSFTGVGKPPSSSAAPSCGAGSTAAAMTDLS
jgi:hypothetical protein